MTDAGHNQRPNILLDLTDEEATFMLENCLANNRLCFSLVMSLADEDITMEERRARAEKITVLQEQFRGIMKKLRAAGALEKEDKE